MTIKRGGGKEGYQRGILSSDSGTYGFVRSVLLIVLVFYVVFLCFVCRRPVSCVPNVASFSRLSILDFPFGFL